MAYSANLGTSSDPHHALNSAKNACEAKTIRAERSGLAPDAPGIPHPAMMADAPPAGGVPTQASSELCNRPAPSPSL